MQTVVGGPVLALRESGFKVDIHPSPEAVWPDRESTPGLHISTKDVRTQPASGGISNSNQN